MEDLNLERANRGCDCNPHCGDPSCVDYPVPPEVWDPRYRPPRRKPEPKSPEQLAAIRAVAWETRRAKYGSRGHR